jgi:hypothetical protein
MVYTEFKNINPLMREKMQPSFQTIDLKFLRLSQQIERLEQKVFKNKKPITTLNQQILLLHYAGMLDNLYQLPISKEKKIKFLAIILNSDISNTKKAINALSKIEGSDLMNSFNYEFLRDTFDDCELNELATKANSMLEKITEGTST